jgi:hypothetical protein
MVKENETHSPTVKFIYLYLEILASISADFPLFYQIHNEVSTVRLQLHNPIFVNSLVDEWKDMYTHMSDKMHVAMISLLYYNAFGFPTSVRKVMLQYSCFTG